MTSKIIHYYRETEPPHSLLPSIKEQLHSSDDESLAADAENLISIDTETCFNVQIESAEDDLDATSKERLEWLLRETFDRKGLRLEESAWAATATTATNATNGDNSNNANNGQDVHTLTMEFGPRMTFTSAFSSNATSICQACGLTQITRLERSKRFRFHFTSSPSEETIAALKKLLHDRMTEQEYLTPLTTFESGAKTEPVVRVPIMEEGREALERINRERGLGFDEFDLDYYTEMFKEKLGRNPTDVECFDMGQSNSEHSRHWYFSGKMIIDSAPKPHTLFEMVKATLPKDVPNNSIIAFHDNSSAIRGYECQVLTPTQVIQAGKVEIKKITLHPILTAETHNFPSAVAPFPGAETGTGGRLRDVMATGRGAYCVAGICAYCVGNLRIPGYVLPWEDGSFEYPSNLASPLEIEVEASDGASDYGNKFGEPVIHGFTRSFGMRLPGTTTGTDDGGSPPNGERFEWVKPIMFTAGIGTLSSLHTAKSPPSPGMLVVKIGGPAYRIGIGGGAASSRVQSSENAELDFDAVQRGDAEMENRMNRLMRACCDLGERNPIVSVHDQGAGGNGNVLKEIVEPAGAEYDIRKVYVGDHTLSVLEIWGAEYQENNALLIRPESQPLFEHIAERENCPIRILGVVTGDGRVVVRDSSVVSKTDSTDGSKDGSKDGADESAGVAIPVDLPLELVLGKMPQKTFLDDHKEVKLVELKLPDGTGVRDCLDRVLRLLSVGSKRFLVHKVDRSVTGLIAQQQCVGPLQLPLSNLGLAAHAHFPSPNGTTTGTAVACGEQPIKGLVSSPAMARMTVAEAMTNLMWAKISKVEDIKASGNWMYAAKLPGEGAKMYDACEALRDALLELGVGIDGGKDSLSMAAQCGKEVVKSPGELTLTCYVTCPDVTLTVTPDLKCYKRCGGKTTLLFVDLGGGKARMGGSALAQVYGQIGNESPDVEDFKSLKNAFLVVQDLIESKKILAGHDRSDGGLAVVLLEMAFAGNCSINVVVPETYPGAGEIATLFNEEAGIVLEVSNEDAKSVMEAFSAKNVPCIEIGTATAGGDSIKVAIGSSVPCIDEKMTALRDLWEETSFRLEKRQRNPECVAQEEAGLKLRKAPEWKLTYTPEATDSAVMEKVDKHKVAVIRQEGSNGDREMLAAFLSAGFEAWDVTVSDLVNGRVTLDEFRGIVFVGGFSYADVLDSGKGWAGVIRFNENVFEQFEAFRKREDTFSLGVCNGCQLMALLGWVPTSDGLPEERQPRLLENDSGKFESRFASVKIVESPAMMFKGMEGSSLGVWIAHGEGRFHFPEKQVHEQVLSSNLAPLRYVNDSNEITQEYPFNPNGSPDGMAALCSENGRHLAMMPHPERVFTAWQWPWMPEEWSEYEVGPWLKMFQNAREFCDNNS